MSMRVQLIHKTMSARTGLGRYAAELESGLRAAGVATGTAPVTNPVPGPLVRLADYLGYDLDAFAQSFPLRATVRTGFDLTHLTSQTLATLLIAGRLPRPVVVTVHDLFPYLLRHDPALSSYRHRLDRTADAAALRGLRRADRLIANSAATKRCVVDALGIPPERIDVTHFGVDTVRFAPRPVAAAFRVRHDLPDGRPVVLYVGTEDPRKDVPTLIRAFARVRQRVPDALLVKVGAAAFADQRRRHLRLCAELGIGDAVRWTDAVPEEDLAGFYNAAAVFAFPSPYEGFGFPVLEALASGTPVVAVNRTSIPELVGSVATLVEPGAPADLAAAIEAALATPGDPAARVRQAHRFTWDRTVAATLASYRRVARGSGERDPEVRSIS